MRNIILLLEGTATLSSPPKPTATVRPQRPCRKNQFGLIFSAACEEMPLALPYLPGACPLCDVARYRPAAITAVQIIAASLSPSTIKRHLRVALLLNVGSFALPPLRGTSLPRVCLCALQSLYHHTSETHVRARDFRACVRAIRTYQESESAKSSIWLSLFTSVNSFHSESAVSRRNVQGNRCLSLLQIVK